MGDNAPMYDPDDVAFAPNGGQPTGEAVEAAWREGQLTRDQWRLLQPWRKGRCGAIVCDPPSSDETTVGCTSFYGGLLICESCPPSVVEHIIDMHNRAIGYGAAEPCRDAEAPDPAVSEPETA